MNTPARTLLWLSAVGVCLFVALLGGSFSRAVEPEQYGPASSAFWLVVGILAATPLWLPASVPNRYKRTLRVLRRCSAIALLAPLYMFGSIVAHDINRGMHGLGASMPAIVQAGLLFLACLLCMAALLWEKSSESEVIH